MTFEEVDHPVISLHFIRHVELGYFVKQGGMYVWQCQTPCWNPAI